MLLEEDILKIAKTYMKDQCKNVNYEVEIAKEEIIKKPYGMIMYFRPKNYHEHILLGNAPFLIENKTGKIIVFGTSQETDYYIKEYEAGRWPHIRRLDSDF